jgi:hypothetical protein
VLVVADVVPEFAEDHQPSEGLERRLGPRIVTVRRLEQSDRCDLLQVVAFEAAPEKAAGAPPAQIAVGENGRFPFGQ